MGDVLSEKLRLGEDIAPNLIADLAQPEDIADDELMVPVDMRGMELDGDVSDQAAEAIGPRGSAQAFLKAKAYFDASAGSMPDDARPKPMTAAAWKRTLEDHSAVSGSE